MAWKNSSEQLELILAKLLKTNLWKRGSQELSWDSTVSLIWLFDLHKLHTCCVCLLLYHLFSPLLPCQFWRSTNFTKVRLEKICVHIKGLHIHIKFGHGSWSTGHVYISMWFYRALHFLETSCLLHISITCLKIYVRNICIICTCICKLLFCLMRCVKVMKTQYILKHPSWTLVILCISVFTLVRAKI